jgi:cardiolipin synthase
MLNLPNFISVARIILAPIFIILSINQDFGWALFIFVVAATSDAIDGLLARLLQQRTVLGSYLDPAADKMLTTSAYVMLAILNFIPGWLAVIVVSRDVIIILGIMILFLTSHPLEIRPSLASKLTTTFQFGTVVFTLFSKHAAFQVPFLIDILIWGTAVATVVSGMQYVGRGIKIFNKGMP